MIENQNENQLGNVSELALYSYIPNEERVKYYIRLFRECDSRQKIFYGVMFFLLLHEENVSYDVAMGKGFLTAVQPFISHIAIFKYQTWRDGIQKVYDRIKASTEAYSVYTTKGTRTVAPVDVLPRNAHGNVSLTVKTKSTELADILRYNSNFEGIKCDVCPSGRTLRDIKLRTRTFQEIRLRGDVRKIASVISPLVVATKLLEKRPPVRMSHLDSLPQVLTTGKTPSGILIAKSVRKKASIRFSAVIGKHQ